jgi:hypothetical protein
MSTAPKIPDTLPRSFTAFVADQMKDWDLLFPAEHGYFQRLFALIGRTPADLFRPLSEIETKMGFPKSLAPIEAVDFLNRSPHYSQWRAAVADIFAKLDPALDAETARSGHARLVVVLSPAQLPADPSRMWSRIEERGKRIALESAGDFVRELGAAAIAQRFTSRSKHGGPYSSWVIEVGQALSPANPSPVVHCSYEALLPYRHRLMREVQKIVESQTVPGPRQLSDRLKKLQILASEGALAEDPILAEFARAILLSGNGTLLINNTFVEWATMQAVRRARPSVAVIGFGIRNKVKPFSSLLIYQDQDATNPIPSQQDVLGSYIDLEVFYQYVWQEFEKYAEYRTNTAYVFCCDGMDEMLVIAPPDCPLLTAAVPLKLSAVSRHLEDWLGI